MTRRPRIAGAAVAALLAAGCAYYNGLYNANHLAADARKAEREGRTGEARSLWMRAAVKAESVVSRFPHSKYRDDAQLLQGLALRQVDACTQAVRPLAAATDSSPDPVIRRDARLLLGECRHLMHESDSAVEILAPLVDVPDSLTRNVARWWRGRAQLALGKYAGALADFTGSLEMGAPFGAAIALVHLGRPAEAAQRLATAMSSAYNDSLWLPALDTLGVADGPAASRLVDRLVQRDALTRGQRARLLLQDGRRWSRQSDDSAAARFTAVVDVAPDSVETRMAQAYLAMAALRRTAALDTVPTLIATLMSTVRDGGAARSVVGRTGEWLAGFAERVNGSEGDELDLFVLAELVRDSVRAPRLASQLFRRVQLRYPTSPFAPKALLAAAALDPADADSLHDLLERQYPASPYTLALAGEGSAAYAALEDSLRILLLDRAAVTTRGPGRN